MVLIFHFMPPFPLAKDNADEVGKVFESRMDGAMGACRIQTYHSFLTLGFVQGLLSAITTPTTHEDRRENRISELHTIRVRWIIIV